MSPHPTVDVGEDDLGDEVVAPRRMRRSTGGSGRVGTRSGSETTPRPPSPITGGSDRLLRLGNRSSGLYRYTKNRPLTTRAPCVSSGSEPVRPARLTSERAADHGRPPNEAVPDAHHPRSPQSREGSSAAAWPNTLRQRSITSSEGRSASRLSRLVFVALTTRIGPSLIGTLTPAPRPGHSGGSDRRPRSCHRSASSPRSTDTRCRDAIGSEVIHRLVCVSELVARDTERVRDLSEVSNRGVLGSSFGRLPVLIYMIDATHSVSFVHRQAGFELRVIDLGHDALQSLGVLARLPGRPDPILGFDHHEIVDRTFVTASRLRLLHVTHACALRRLGVTRAFRHRFGAPSVKARMEGHRRRARPTLDRDAAPRANLDA